MRMRDLSDLTDIYNMQEIIKNHTTEIIKKYPYNMCKCTQASSFSGCFNRFLSKVKISLPVCAKHVELYVKGAGGFSCVNARLAFDSSILFLRGEDDKFRKDLKLIYKIRDKESNTLEEKRRVTKILKIDQNNQYGNSQTPTNRFNKKDKNPVFCKFNLITEGLSDENKTAHLFVVNMQFDRKMQARKVFISTKYTHQCRQSICFSTPGRYET